MKKNQIVRAREDFYRFYKKGDKFKIIKINNDSWLMPIEALHLKTKNIYGFWEYELE